MRELYKKYIEDRSPVWAESSVRSESIRLNRIIDRVVNTKEGAQALWMSMGNYGGYTKVTLWGRLVNFIAWAIENEQIPGPNQFKIFRDRNPRCFRNQYIRKPAQNSFLDARSLIMTIPDPELRNKALQLLIGGLRFSESYTLTADGYVTGKGGKVRKVYISEILGPMAPKNRYRALLRQLKKLGLKPHKLRSIRATDIVDRGGNAFQLKKIFGWASLATAESYVDSKESELKKLMSPIEEKVAQ